MKRFVGLILALAFVMTSSLSAQPMAHSNYLSGSFNSQFSRFTNNYISFRAGYHYYFKNNLAIGAIVRTDVDFWGLGNNDISSSIGPSLKVHLPAFRWLYIEPAGLVTLSYDKPYFSTYYWGAISLGLDIPINSLIFLEVACCDQITANHNQVYSKLLFDIGFSVLITKSTTNDGLVK